MRELIIISYDPGMTYAKHYVVEPTGNTADGQCIGSMYIAGHVIEKLASYDKAVRYIEGNR